MNQSKKSILLTIFLVAALVLINIFLVWPLFLGEYDKNMGSIGVAHILNARYISRFFFHGWNPFWYGGFPNHLIYPLLAPITLAFMQKILSFLTMAQVYRLTVATAYVLIPVGIFFLTRYLTKRDLPGFLAGLICILAPSANYFLIPGFKAIGLASGWAPWQLSVIVDFGEGPHMIDLAIVPLAAMAYFKLLRQPTFAKFLVTAILLSIVVSINLFSAYALGYFLLGIFLSEILLGRFKENCAISLLLIPLIYGLMAYGYDLSMIKSLAASGYIHPENVFRLPSLTTLFLLFIFGALPTLFIFYEVFKNKARLQTGVILGIWFLIFWAIPCAFYKGYWFGSQPNRYMPELNLTAAIIVAVIFTWVYDKVKQKLGLIMALILLNCFIASLLFVSRGFMQNSWRIVSANPHIKATSEYKISQWLKENISYEKGERAYLTGSPAFFLNEFADVPQIRGDEDNAQADPWWADIVYQVNKGEDGQLAIGWLSAYNVRYLVVDDGAVTPFKDFDYPQKFGSLEPVAEIDGFKIYENPEAGSIIQAVDIDKVGKLKPFSHPKKPVLDKEGLSQYLKAIKEVPVGVKLDYDYQYRTNPDLVKIKVTNASKNTGILFKSTYDRGWQAKKCSMLHAQCSMADITKTGPDLMLVKPHLSGDYTLELSYHRPLVEYLGYLTTLGTVVFLGILIIKKGNFNIEITKEASREQVDKEEKLE